MDITKGMDSMHRNLPKQLHLVLSGCIVILAGLVYGAYPDKIMPMLLHFEVDAIQLRHIFRAIMGIYFGMGIFWIYGVFKSEYWKAATLSNILFMGGIALGRIIALLFDGFSGPFLLALLLEVWFMCWGWYNLRHYPDA